MTYNNVDSFDFVGTIVCLSSAHALRGEIVKSNKKGKASNFMKFEQCEHKHHGDIQI